MNKHEISAWWRFALSGLYGIYFCRLLFFTDGSIAEDGWENAREMLTVLVFLVFLLDAYIRRRKGIAEDERDRAISGIAARDALVALGLLVLLTPIIVGGGNLENDAEIVLKVVWFDFYVFACVAFAIWVEAAVTVFHHWRDRR